MTAVSDEAFTQLPVASMLDTMLDERSFHVLREYILPRPEELRWEEVPWRTTFWDAVVEAQTTDRPILLWAMNGHPLACT